MTFAAGKEGAADRQRQEARRREQVREVQAMTWNVGGMPTERMTEMVQLLPVGLRQVEVLAFQEVSCPPRVMEVETGKRQR